MELFKDAEPLDELQLFALCRMPDYATPMGRMLFLEHKREREPVARVFPVVLFGVVLDESGAGQTGMDDDGPPFIFKCGVIECVPDGFRMLPVDFNQKDMNIVFRFWDKPPAPEALRSVPPLGRGTGALQ